MSHVFNKPKGDIPNGYYQEKLKLFQQALPTLVLKRVLFSYESVGEGGGVAGPLLANQKDLKLVV